MDHRYQDRKRLSSIVWRRCVVSVCAVTLVISACTTGAPATQPPAESPTPAVSPVISPTSTPIPPNPELEAHMANARDYRARGQAALALIEAEQAVAIDPNHPEAQALLRTLRPEATAALPTAFAQATAVDQFGRGQATVAAQVEVVRQLTPGAMGESACPRPVEVPNPWCYTFVSGRQILNPPTNFCTFFACAPQFFQGQGFVVQCQDLTFSKTGGTPSACAGQGGEQRTLFEP